mmetsp:Transcript_25376/g.76956  ORF Transcript_25376/g.76956 Transcript_25376/m.76956 type:complete len:92 (-) Transcript_25376:3054-3329(-)|eukprot:scaffold10326_cov31-Tisochrysis_lutea.AAC.3
MVLLVLRVVMHRLIHIMHHKRQAAVPSAALQRIRGQQAPAVGLVVARQTKTMVVLCAARVRSCTSLRFAFAELHITCMYDVATMHIPATLR